MEDKGVSQHRISEFLRDFKKQSVAKIMLSDATFNEIFAQTKTFSRLQRLVRRRCEHFTIVHEKMREKRSGFFSYCKFYCLEKR